MPRPSASLGRLALLGATLILGIATAKDTVVKAGQSIQTAIDNAKPGDKIVVDAGTYAEQVEITKNGIYLSAKDGATIVLPSTLKTNGCSGVAGPGSQAGICITGSDVVFDAFNGEHTPVKTVGTYVENVKVEGFTVVGFGLNIAIVGAKNADVRKNTVKDGQAYGILTVGSISSLVTRNTVDSSDLKFIGICMDDKSDVHVTQNVISDYGIALCVETNGADVGHNKVSNCCIGVWVDPHVDGARVTHNHISSSNPLCQPYFEGFAGGILIDGATDTDVQHNEVFGITDFGNADQTAYGIAIVDEAGAVSSGNTVTHNTLYNNDLDILFNTTGTNNEVAHNNCTTPSQLCSK